MGKLDPVFVKWQQRADKARAEAEQARIEATTARRSQELAELEVATLRGALDEARAHVETLEAQLGASGLQARIAEMEGELAEAAGREAALSLQVHDLGAQLAAEGQRAAGIENARDTALLDAHTWREATGALRFLLEQAQTQLAETQDELAKRTGEVEGLSAELSALRAEPAAVRLAKVEKALEEQRTRNRVIQERMVRELGKSAAQRITESLSTAELMIAAAGQARSRRPGRAA